MRQLAALMEDGEAKRGMCCATEKCGNRLEKVSKRPRWSCEEHSEQSVAKESTETNWHTQPLKTRLRNHYASVIILTNVYRSVRNSKSDQ